SRSVMQHLFGEAAAGLEEAVRQQRGENAAAGRAFLRAAAEKNETTAADGCTEDGVPGQGARDATETYVGSAPQARAGAQRKARPEAMPSSSWPERADVRAAAMHHWLHRCFYESEAAEARSGRSRCICENECASLAADVGEDLSRHERRRHAMPQRLVPPIQCPLVRVALWRHNGRMRHQAAHQLFDCCPRYHHSSIGPGRPLRLDVLL
ncbi:MAG: hypothetical protein SGPRY_010767, partial [Prymnesium sp.]